jgi:outer membrane lipoprotein-sorting protein
MKNFLLIPQGHKFRLSRLAAQLSFIPQGHKFRLSRPAAQLSFIPQGHKFRLSRPAAQLSFIFALLPLVFTTALRAETPEERGLAIARAADARENGFGDFSSDMEMILRNRHGQESRRAIRIRTLEVEGDGDKSLTIFDSPGDVKGTALLTFSHKVSDDDQWLFLPALKRVKRIASRNKSGSFMGSEFAYEDIASQEVEKYTYKYLGDALYNGHDCTMVERSPVDAANSGYTRMVSWQDKDEYRLWKVEYSDRKASHLKTLILDDYHQYLKRFWRPHKMEMVNHQNGKSTELRWRNFQYRTGLSASDFSENSLKRVK